MVLAAAEQTAADWGAIATAFGAAVAFVVGVATVRQRSLSEGRAEWWQRAQWAIDQATSSTDEKVEAGLIALRHLIESPLATDDDIRLVRDLAANMADRAGGP